MGFFGDIHMVSHLKQMCFHHFIVGQFLVIVDFFTKFDHVCWINFSFIIKVPDISNSFEMLSGPLWIWIGTIEPSRKSLRHKSWGPALLHRRCKNRKFSSFTRIDHLSTISGIVSIRTESTLSITSAFGILSGLIKWFPVNFVVSGCQSTDFKAQSEVFTFFDLINQLSYDFFVDLFNWENVRIANFCNGAYVDSMAHRI